MKIERRWTVKYKDIEVGQVFECWGYIFIKCYDLRRAEGSITNLSDGHVESEPSDDMEVTVYDNAKVVLI